MPDTAFASASDLARAIKNRQISSRELTQLYIERIERFDADINAVVVRDFAGAQEAAERADAALAAGDDLGPLHGVPITVKEAYDAVGLPTTWGLPAFEDNIASVDSDTVARLKAAGAHLLGKTNVPVNLGDFQSFNPIYGTTNNPWDLARTPGGSSGGSAAALAAGLTALEAGSDIGGSIRNPAHFCGVYGHKPTWGVVSDRGHSLPGMFGPADLAVVGPMARSAEDLRLAMELVAGPTAAQAKGWQLQLPQPSKRSLTDFRVALWPTESIAPVSTEMSERVLQLGQTLRELGATVSEQARPDIDTTQCFETYMRLLWGVMSAGMSADELQEMRALSGQFAATDQSVPALTSRSAVQDHQAWSQANNQRFALRAAWQAFFSDWDILICPQMATTAFAHDQGDYLNRTLLVDNEPQHYFQQIFWSGLVIAAHLPSTVFPTGLTADGLPLGLQAVGAEFNDYQTIEFTRLLAAQIGGYVPPPGYRTL